MHCDYPDSLKVTTEMDYLHSLATAAGLRLIGVQTCIGLSGDWPVVVLENPSTKKIISVPYYAKSLEAEIMKHKIASKPEPKISEDVESLPKISSQDIEFLESLQRIAQELSNASAELNALCTRRKQS